MSKYTGKLAVLGALLGVILPVASLAAEPVSSQPKPDFGVLELVKKESLDLADIGVENPGLLQSNPFYFMKNFRRSTQRTLTFSYLKKAELELDILAQKLAELKRVKEINLDLEGFNVALDNYGSNVENLKIYSRGLTNDEFLDKLTARILIQLRVLNELKAKEDFRLNEKLENLQNGLSEVTVSIFANIDPSNLYKRLEKALNGQKGGLFKELVLAEALDKLSEKSSNDLDREFLAAAKENLLIAQIAKIDSMNLAPVLPGVFSLLPGNVAGRIKVLDELKERAGDSDLKNELNVIRQNLLDLAINQREIGKIEAGKLISEAESLVGALERVSANLKKSASFGTLLSRAKFNLKQAQDSFDGNQYGAAFGQASLSLAASKNALAYLAIFENLANGNNLLSETINSLKSFYDQLTELANKNNLTAENSAELSGLLMASEKALAKVVDLENKNGNPDAIVQALRDAKHLIYKSSQTLASLTEAMGKAAKEKRASQPLLKRVLNVQ